MKGIETIAEYLTYDYMAIFKEKGVSTGGGLFQYFVHPAVPIVAVILYLILSKPVMCFLKDKFGLDQKVGPDKKKGKIDPFVKLHNFILAVYSAWVCCNAVPLVAAHLREHGFRNTLCGGNKSTLWDGKMDFWIFNFYISKFYELVDTWIIYAKGKDPSFLQVFHHAGIAILMWALYVSYSSPVIICVCFNSFIHTLMYSYYADSERFKALKPYMTTMQIIQIVVGTALTIPFHFFMGDDCLNEAQHFTLFAMECYTITLTYLFCVFYKENYKSEKKNISDTASDSSRASSESDLVMLGKSKGLPQENPNGIAKKEN